MRICVKEDWKEIETVNIWTQHPKILFTMTMTKELFRGVLTWSRGVPSGGGARTRMERQKKNIIWNCLWWKCNFQKFLIHSYTPPHVDSNVDYSFVHSFVLSYIHSWICSFSHSSVQLCLHSSIHFYKHSLFINSLIHTFYCSFIHSFLKMFAWTIEQLNNWMILKPALKKLKEKKWTKKEW